MGQSHSLNKLNNSLPFCYSGFPHARLTNYNRIVFFPFRQYLDAPLDFIIPAYNWIHVTTSSTFGHILAIFSKCLVFPFMYKYIETLQIYNHKVEEISISLWYLEDKFCTFIRLLSDRDWDPHQQSTTNYLYAT